MTQLQLCMKKLSSTIVINYGMCVLHDDKNAVPERQEEKTKKIFDQQKRFKKVKMCNSHKYYTIVDKVVTKSKIYIQNGRSYLVTKRSPLHQKTYLKCTLWSKKKERCPGRAYLKEGSTHIHVYKKHTCSRNMFIEDVHKAREAACKLALEQEEMKPADIRAKISTEYSAEVMGHPSLTLKSLSSTLKRLRKRHVPKLPKTFEEFKKLLKNSKYEKTLDNEQFFREILTNEANTYHNVVFYSDRDSKLLKKKDSTMEVDGTFRIMPKILGLYQLLTLVVVHNGVALPVAFVLMTRKTEEAYVHALKYLKESIGFSPKEIISDSETALLNALHEVFPESAKTTCYFHYTKAVVLKALMFGLKKDALKTEDGKRILGCILAIPLLPAEHIREGIKIMESMIEDEDLLEFLDLLKYVEEIWVNRVGVEVLSVFQKVHRTTNMIESYHSKFGDTHPNLWKFLGILRKLEKKAATEAIVMRSGEVVRDNRRLTYILNEGNQIRNENDLLLNRIDMAHFLERGKYQVKSLMGQLLGLKESEAEGDNLIGFPAMVQAKNQKHKDVKPAPGSVRVTANGCVRIEGTGLIRVPASVLPRPPAAMQVKAPAPKRGRAAAIVGDEAVALKRSRALASALLRIKAPAKHQILSPVEAPAVAQTSTKKCTVVRIPVPVQASATVQIITPRRSNSSAGTENEVQQQPSTAVQSAVLYDSSGAEYCAKLAENEAAVLVAKKTLQRAIRKGQISEHENKQLKAFAKEVLEPEELQGMKKLVQAACGYNTDVLSTQMKESKDDPDIAETMKRESYVAKVRAKFSYIFETARALLERESRLKLKGTVVLPPIISQIPIGKINQDHLMFACYYEEDVSTLLRFFEDEVRVSGIPIALLSN